ncbi:NlpC/P60 family protein [Streptomyces sp. NBC_01619]|uniref:C40 family peptidase n=1 Tax=Streptomyces sp. NBC_01619 TaxID=2975901 RepID=UPI0022542005|nr:NlpC/P60 family protein [Streptomyces sp. NBC_01619]MCX4511699.1 NlpC/P60 family protein [Streptomyces sp. NBC_01619]
MNRRRCAAAAITVVCAVTLLVSPGQAFAAPAPPGPPKKSLEEVRKELDELYHKASSATDAYNLAEEQAKQQSDQIVQLAKEIVKGQARIDDLKDRAGATARAQYRGGGLPPEAQFALTDDPQLFLDAVGRINSGGKATKDLLGEMNRTQADLAAYSREASTQWARLEANRVKQEKAKKEINKQIAAAKSIEKQLQKEELARLLKLEQDAAYRAQTAWLGSGVLKEINGRATEQGKAAVAFATKQIGKPYVWGAEGPGSYDCSGLTSQAWAAAGRGIPRTSQEQWRQLPRIDIKDMRPGDLIIYHADASHVGMYVGDGAIVHAPRPGRNVTLAGAGSMAILGVVRPDKQMAADPDK